MPSLPAFEYRARLGRLRADALRLARLDAHFSRARLLTFLAIALLALFAWRGTIAWAWPAAGLCAFGLLVMRHDRVVRAATRVSRTVAFYERGVARIEDRWAGGGATGERYRNDRHPYANDLDIFGDASLFQLLSIARTRAGEDALAAWLSAPSLPATLAKRQEAVGELASALHLREVLSLAGVDAAASVDSETLVRWADGESMLRSPFLRLVAIALTVGVTCTAAYGFATGSYAAVITLLIAQVLIAIPQRARIQQVLHRADGPARDLDAVAHVLTHIERESFSAPVLAEMRQALDRTGLRASAAIRRLHRLVELHDWQHNQFFAPFAAAMLWGTHLAWAIEAWRRHHGAHIRTWLRVVGEFEALNSLAAYRYEHPDDVWPEISADGARFEAMSLGHPMIPSARMVRNDVRLTAGTPLVIVSGSNMSGKSTLLRTVGVNAVLALAGAPVRAVSLRLTPVQVGATLRIQDSLQEGRSRFYAEITRIRELADLAAGATPLLFLLDELFHGTNSHDRMAGAAGVLRSLLDRGAIGLITTHDLALTAIAAELGGRASNVHFEDDFAGGEIHFDYRMKPGPVTRSNAIALMRAVGLDVPPAE